MPSDTNRIEKVVTVHGEKDIEYYRSRLSSVAKEVLQILNRDLTSLTKKHVLDLLSLQSKLTISEGIIKIIGKKKHGGKLESEKFFSSSEN